jgi:hypothetical protein
MEISGDGYRPFLFRLFSRAREGIMNNDMKIINVPELNEKCVLLKDAEADPYTGSTDYLRMAGELMGRNGKENPAEISAQTALEELNLCIGEYKPAIEKLLSIKGGADCEH